MNGSLAPLTPLEEKTIRVRSHKSVESSLAVWNGKKVFIKKYPKPATSWSAFKALLRGSAAACVVKGTLLLVEHGFNTSKVIGIVEDKASLLTRSSAAIFEDLSHCEELHARVNYSGADRTLIKNLAGEVARMHRSGITHGDMNLHNILIAPGQNSGFIWIDNRRTRASILFGPQRARNLSQLYMHAWHIPAFSKLRFLAYYRKSSELSKNTARGLAATAIERCRGRHSLTEPPACCRQASNRLAKS